MTAPVWRRCEALDRRGWQCRFAAGHDYRHMFDRPILNRIVDAIDQWSRRWVTAIKWLTAAVMLGAFVASALDGDWSEAGAWFCCLMWFRLAAKAVD